MAPYSRETISSLLQRQIDADVATPEISKNSTSGWSAQLVATAEKSWSVSGTSVLSAWGLALVGSVLFVAFFAWRRRKDPIIHLPRYLTLLRNEPALRSKRAIDKDLGGEWHPFIPSSNPASLPGLRAKEEEAATAKLVGMEKEVIARAVDSAAEKGATVAEQIAVRDAATLRVRTIKGMEMRESWLAWARPAWRDFLVEVNVFDHTAAIKRDRQLLDYLGLDALTFLEFLRLLRWLFAMITVFVAIPLLCGNYYINTRTEWGSTVTSRTEQNLNDSSASETSLKAMADLQLFTAANITGNAWWVHISVEFVVTLLVCMQVIVYSRRHERNIETWSDMNSGEVAFKTLLITNLNIPAKSKDTKKHITVLHAKSLIRLAIGCSATEELEITIKQEKMGELAAKIKRWNEVERLKVAARIHGLKKRKAIVEKKGGGGCLGFCTGEVSKSDKEAITDAARIYAQRKKDQNQHREKQDKSLVRTDVTAAFVTWATAKEAHEKLQRLQALKGAKFKAERCPRSVSVLWRNLEKDPAQIASQRITGAVIRWTITLLNSIPVMFITVLTNLDAVIESTPKLRTMRDTSVFWDAVFTAAAGIIPATLAALFIMALPYIMRALSRFQGALSRGQLDKDVIRQMFIFLLLSKFVFFSLLGIAYETYLNVKDQIGREDISTIITSLGDVPAKITKTYINQSSYWLSFFPIKCVVVCMQLIQLPRYFFKAWDFYITREANTPDRLDIISQPGEFEYAIEYTNILFGLVVALVYTPLAPIVPICGAMYFWTASVVYQNQLTFVDETIETDGKVWKVIMNRLLVALSMMQILMTLTVILKTQPFATSTLPFTPRILPTIAAALPLLITLGLARHVHTRRTAAQIISGRQPRVGSAPLKIQPFELDILRRDALKTLRVFRQDEDLYAELSRTEGIEGLEGLVPQVRRRRKELDRQKEKEGIGTSGDEGNPWEKGRRRRKRRREERERKRIKYDQKREATRNREKRGRR